MITRGTHIYGSIYGFSGHVRLPGGMCAWECCGMLRFRFPWLCERLPASWGRAPSFPWTLNLHHSPTSKIAIIMDSGWVSFRLVTSIHLKSRPKRYPNAIYLTAFGVFRRPPWKRAILQTNSPCTGPAFWGKVIRRKVLGKVAFRKVMRVNCVRRKSPSVKYCIRCEKRSKPMATNDSNDSNDNNNNNNNNKNGNNHRNDSKTLKTKPVLSKAWAELSPA